MMFSELIKSHLFLSLAGGLLLGLGWMRSPVFLFFAFLPLWKLEKQLKPGQGKRIKLRFFFYIYLSLLIWNATTTWWLYNATLLGLSFAVLINTLVMTVPWMLFRATKNALGKTYGFFAFFLYWMSYEMLHYNWEIAWPWLTLGNAFAFYSSWVQWYEYTGVLGGSLWILCINLLLYQSWESDLFFNKKLYAGYAVFVFILPMLFSWYLYSAHQEKGKEVEIVIMQPNIDPYSEKFVDTDNFIPFTEQMDRFIALSQKKVTPSTELLLFPETALDDPYDEKIIREAPQNYTTIHKLKNYLRQYPRLSLITGLTTYAIYPHKDSANINSRYQDQQGFYYDMFNAAVLFDENSKVHFYHKSKLVPGIETIPYPFLFRFLIINLGGTTGGVGRQKAPTVFSDQEKTKYAPLICYESVFGDYVSGFVRKGAQVLCIITNDAWWGNTPGHRQHFQYARLRAIEFRRAIARSANTGISGFINQRGDIIQKTQYWKPDAIRGKIRANQELTFYARQGDYIGRLCWFLAPLLFLTGFIKKRTGTKKEIMKKKQQYV